MMSKEKKFKWPKIGEQGYNTKIIKEVALDPKFKDWGSLGKMSIAGYRIIEADEGPRIDELKSRRYMRVYRPYDVLYNHSYGRVSKFFEGLLEKKIYGTKCPHCGDKFMPPRAHCWRPECNLEETEWIELKPQGILHSYTILGFAAEAFLPQLPFVLGYVRVDDCNTLIALRVSMEEAGYNIEDMECDTPVTIKFVDQPQGSVLDIYAVPIEKPKSRKTPEQKARLKKQLEVIYSWVKEKYG
jgi:uncharacterized OB-fold protein